MLPIRRPPARVFCLLFSSMLPFAIYAQKTVIIKSGSPVQVATYKKGDSVQIQASINTSDPTEGPENEPLVIQSTTGFSATIVPYNQTFNYKFTAPNDGTLTAYIPGYDGDESGSVTVTSGRVNQVQLVCRPLDPATGSSFSSLLDDIYNIRQRLGRHCYFLITYNDNSLTTFGAYDISNTLTSAQDGDPKNPPGGCGGSGTTGFGLGSDCLSVPSPPDGDTILQDLQSLVPNSEGSYDSVTNNSNGWIKERIAGFGLSVTPPAGAISSKTQFCTQVPNIVQSLKDAGVPNFLINKLKAKYMPVTCP